MADGLGFKLKKVNPDEVRALPDAEPTSQVTPGDLKTGQYLVVDADTLSQEQLNTFGGHVVGTIEYPTEFCPVQGCKVANTKHPFSFVQENNLWIHNSCGKPTLAWWSRHWDDLVNTTKGVKLPWSE